MKQMNLLLNEFESKFFKHIHNRDWENIFDMFSISKCSKIRGKNILQYIVIYDTNCEVFNILCEKYTNDEIRKMAESLDDGGDSIYHLCAHNCENFELLEKLNEIIPARNYFRLKNKCGTTVIDIAKYEDGYEWIKIFKNICKKK